MPNPQLISYLFLFTMIATLAVAAGAYVIFLRKRSNRRPVERADLAGRTMAPSETPPPDSGKT